MNMKIAAWDYGKDIVGLLDLESNVYSYFYKEDKPKAIHELLKYDVLVTFDGIISDAKKLEKEMGKSFMELGFAGIQIDTSDICYPNIPGSELMDCYYKNLNEGRIPIRDDDVLIGSYGLVGSEGEEDPYRLKEEHYIDDNWSDCFMAMSLFVSWIRGELDGEVCWSDTKPADFGLSNLKNTCDWNFDCKIRAVK